MTFEENQTENINKFITLIQKNIVNVMKTSDDEYERLIALEFGQEVVENSNG